VLVVDAIEQLSAQGGTATVGAVAARLSVAPSTASRLIERAVATGMVERGRAASDARRVALMLTDEGGALAERARSYRRDRLADVLGSWPPERIERFSVDLQAFAEAALPRQETVQQ
jgi:DNA-binding MarR family transcriptional regulator